MGVSFRATTILFSWLVYGAVVATGVFFAGNDLFQQEKVYHVSLAEFAPTAPTVALQLEPSALVEPESDLVPPSLKLQPRP